MESFCSQVLQGLLVAISNLPVPSSMFVATGLNKISKIVSISGCFFSSKFIYAVQDHGFESIESMALIELFISGVIFNFSRALLNYSPDKYCKFLLTLILHCMLLFQRSISCKCKSLSYVNL